MTNKKNIKQNVSNIKLCPHCQEKKLIKDKICPNCGFDESNNQSSINNMHFGFVDQTVVIVKDEMTSITQKNTKSISIVKKINSVLVFLVAIVSILMLIMPIFSSNNISTRLDMIKEFYGYPTISEYLKVNSSTNFISLIGGIANCLAESQLYNAVGVIFLIYELTMLAFILFIVISGIIILFMALRELFFNKPFYKCKTLLGVNLTFLLLLIFAFGCYGAYVIVCACVSFLTFIIIYINGLLAKEKAFLPKNLIHKTICGAGILALLCLSSIGLNTLNVDVGADLFKQQATQSGNAVLSPNYFLCNGLFLELVQFIQRASGDDFFTTTAFVFNLGSFVSHALYLAFASMAFVSLLKSLSNQNVRFPIKYIVVSTVSFYCFATFSFLFNSVVNEAAYQYYHHFIGFQSTESLENKNVYIVLYTNIGMWLSVILNLPLCIYCAIAKRICLKRKY